MAPHWEYPRTTTTKEGSRRGKRGSFEKRMRDEKKKKLSILGDGTAISWKPKVNID